MERPELLDISDQEIETYCRLFGHEATRGICRKCRRGKRARMWSWILAVVGITGISFVGRKNVIGWLFLLVNECLWIVYAVQSSQYGFIVASFVYSGVYVRSYIHWKRDGAISL